MKNVLILCTKNSFRSIVAEALINKNLNNIQAFSAGIEASKGIAPNAKLLLERDEAWDADAYTSKTLDKIMDNEFDLVVTICNEAEEICPEFPRSTEVIHVAFDDPEGEELEPYETVYQEIREKLLPIVRKKLS